MSQLCTHCEKPVADDEAVFVTSSDYGGLKRALFHEGCSDAWFCARAAEEDAADDLADHIRAHPMRALAELAGYDLDGDDTHEPGSDECSSSCDCCTAQAKAHLVVLALTKAMIYAEEHMPDMDGFGAIMDRVACDFALVLLGLKGRKVRGAYTDLGGPHTQADAEAICDNAQLSECNPGSGLAELSDAERWFTCKWHTPKAEWCERCKAGPRIIFCDYEDCDVTVQREGDICDEHKEEN
jgi:hypothetical protein